MQPSQCTKVPITKGETEAFIQCKTQLNVKLEKLCDFTKIENPGDLLYFKIKDEVTCCFDNHKCDTWFHLQQQIYKNAKTYLKNKNKVLNQLVEFVGYKTCHHLNSLDSQKCAEDCKSLQTRKFAKNCTSNGGLFKCCIRRDKRGCNECRFCCTLPMCTYPPGGLESTVFDGLNGLNLNSQKNKIQANDIFFSNGMIYKSEDYRCLKPYSHEDPNKWHTYDMEAYRKSFSPKTLDNVHSFKYDNNLHNFVDPMVLKKFTRSKKDSEANWKRSYGYHYVKNIPGFHFKKSIFGVSLNINATSCVNKCNAIENSRFAQLCAQEGGYFKCCVGAWGLGVFEKTRLSLIKDGLIKAEQDQVCNHTSITNLCNVCTLDGICTKKNPLSGETTQIFYRDMADTDTLDNVKSEFSIYTLG